MLACFAFAEMGAMFPHAGGQYVFVREAYGEFAAFLYGWMIFTVSVAGTVAALGAGFAEYLGKIFPALAAERAVFSLPTYVWTAGHRIHEFGGFHVTLRQLGAISGLAIQTLANTFGLRPGAELQNVANSGKVAATSAIGRLG